MEVGALEMNMQGCSWRLLLLSGLLLGACRSENHVQGYWYCDQPWSVVLAFHADQSAESLLAWDGTWKSTTGSYTARTSEGELFLTTDVLAAFSSPKLVRLFDGSPRAFKFERSDGSATTCEEITEAQWAGYRGNSL